MGQVEREKDHIPKEVLELLVKIGGLSEMVLIWKRTWLVQTLLKVTKANV